MAQQLTHHRSVIIKSLVYLFLIIFLSLVIFPIFWTIISSFKPMSEIFIPTPKIFPKIFTLTHYQEVLKYTKYLLFMRNSLIIGLSATLLALIFGFLGGYALARLNYKGKTSYMSVLLLTQMFPGVLLVIPLFKLMSMLGILDTHLSLIAAYTGFTTPLSVWLIRGYIRGIPVEIEEAALVDGCNIRKMLLFVLLPIIKPGIVVAGIFCFISSWGEYIYALTFSSSYSTRTLPVGLANLFQEQTAQWGWIMASSVMYTIPVFILCMLVQKHIVKGLSAGAIK